MKPNKEVEKLLSDLKKAGYTRRQIEIETDYAPGYIDQALSRNKVSDKFYKKAIQLLREKGDIEEIDLGKAVKEIRAICDVLLIASAEILAKDRPAGMVSSYREQFEKMVNDRLSEREP